ncbi:hypothetical protein CARUB_v10022134mg [Capsella rubella]|uniref:Uncharacterized protein n=1 Tax=Capsella rubella TaxID=81985 RepID=R0GFI2_9BRAS|nr:hypothetical protein CARUB_v10022134mg [Capsella rubella]
MGNCFSASLSLDEPVQKVFEWLVEKRGYTHNLVNNLVDLEATMEELKAKRDDLLRRRKREEDISPLMLEKFQVWLNTIETIADKVNGIVNDRNIERQSFISRYRYGESVFLTLKKVEKLKNEDFEVIAVTHEVKELPLQPTIVGQEKMLEKAWNHLIEDGVGVMGFYGMGGVGKTTLLKQIYNKFSNDRRGFEHVILVVVSRDSQMEKIQDDIAHEVGLNREEWKQKDKSQKEVCLHNFLKEKRFVLFLDDVWKKVDLTEIGVPDPRSQKGCKLAFTTRSQEVCRRMAVEKLMEVRCLEENEAFDLFQKKVGETTLGSNPGILELASKVVKKCCGLPLALNIIGETMSCKETVEEWRNAINVLNSYAAEFDGMEDKVLPLLKFSYDSLKGDHVKSCLLYCALFPEDAVIRKKELIEYWICEEFIDGSESIERAEDKGYEIIGSLARASLLMEGVAYDGEAFVFMHDVVREMALWIASELGIQKEAFVVSAGVGLLEIPKVKNWNVVRRMSLMDKKIHLDGSPECMELTTLLLRVGGYERGNWRDWEKMIELEFFNYMPKLVVLDLSRNRSLSELPEGISNLVSLQYLNLTETSIRCLPKKVLQALKKLIHLDLEYTSKLESIVGISDLCSLKVLKLSGTHLPWDLDTVKELETLEHLEILTIIFNVTPSLERFLSSPRLKSITRSLVIWDEVVSSPNRNLESTGISLSGSIDKLREFSIVRCRIPEIKIGRICSFLSLVRVYITDCDSLKELTFLMFAPNLRVLNVRDAKDMEDIINREKACEWEESVNIPFQKLNEVYLGNLPQLKNIYWSPLPFPCLEKIEVRNCPSLKKLPLDSQSGKQGENGCIIRYTSPRWIKGVQWEDEATKIRFLSSCKKV